MCAAVTVPSRFRFYLSLTIVVVLVGMVGVLVLSTEPDVVEMRAPVSWIRVSSLTLASPPRIGVSSSRAPVEAPTRIALDAEVLPYVLAVRLDGRAIWERKGDADVLSSLAFGRLQSGRSCDELSAYVIADSKSGDPERVAVTLVPDEVHRAQEGDGVCVLDLTFSATGREELRAGSRVTVELKAVDREVSVLSTTVSEGV